MDVDTHSFQEALSLAKSGRELFRDRDQSAGCLRFTYATENVFWLKTQAISL